MSVTHRVALPRGAETWVDEAQSVEPDDVLATRRPPGEATALALSGPLRVPARLVGEMLVVGPGAQLEAGAVLARSPAGREVRVPQASLLLGWDPDEGIALLAPLGTPTPILGHVRGVVSAVDDAAIEISVRGALLTGVAGSGEAVHGELRMAVSDPADELRATVIDVGSSGQILVGGSRASAETLIRARAMGVAGIVLGGVLDKELRDFEAIQRRRREVGATVGSLGILLVEGYGKVGFDPQLFAWFSAQAGRLASLFGSERQLYVYDADPPPDRQILARAGQRVLAHRRPHAGMSGTVVRVLDGLHAASSGVAVRAAIVRFDDGQLAAVPLANLEGTGAGPGA